jgi:hypothetical protein
MKKTIIAGLGLALLSTPAFAAGGVCNTCVEHEQALKAGPVNGYLVALRDQYKPVTVIITVDRSVTPPVIHWRMAMGCGGCGGRGETHAGTTGTSGGGGGSIFGAPTGRDVLNAIAAGMGDVLSGAGPSEGGADVGHATDTSTGNSGLSGGERNANGDSLGIGN